MILPSNVSSVAILNPRMYPKNVQKVLSLEDAQFSENQLFTPIQFTLQVKFTPLARTEN